MKTLRILLALVSAAFSLLFLSACMVPLNPVCAEDRAVTSASDESMTFTVYDGMVFVSSLSERGLRFPEGVYTLEAEDADYWYFRAPAPIEFRVLRGGRPVNGRDIPGGIMLSKSFSMVPAAGYTLGEDEAHRTMIWRLGGEFLRVKGSSWRASFKWWY